MLFFILFYLILIFIFISIFIFYLLSSFVQEGDTQIGTDGRTIYDHSNLAELGSKNPETQRMVELAKLAEGKSTEVASCSKKI